MVQVKIKKLHPDAVIPRYARELDAGFDLVAVKDTIIKPGESAKIPTGLAIALPPGYELQIRPRSGISDMTKLRISNTPGTVDAGYRGEISVLIDNIAQLIPASSLDGEILFDTTFMLLGIDGKPTDSVSGNAKEGSHFEFTYLVRKGDRIAQGVLATVSIAQFEEADELDETERGNEGFGHTGITA